MSKSNTHHLQRFAPLVGLSCLFSCLPFAQAATDCTQVTQIPQSECEALVDFYVSTNGSNWRNHTGWNETDAPCDWFGVSCSDGHVIRLSISGNQLSGSIPESLGNLSYLQFLILGYNQLSGSIPDSLGNLSSLQSLYLYNNQLSGAIPESLGNLSHLQFLNLIHNQLSDSIPESLGNLSSLQSLSLYNNQLSGSIPESLGNLSYLQFLILGDNQLSGSIPESLGNLSYLQFLNMHNNELCGDIPLSLINLNMVFSIWDNNYLTASDPDLIEWLNSKSLRWENTQTVGPEYCRANLVRLDSFMATPHSKNVTLDWTTGTETEKGNAGFFLWRAAVDDNGGYTKIIALEELNSHQMDCVEGKLTAVNEPIQQITAIGNSREGACYFFKDNSINEEGTYYYVLEEVEMNGKRTFHCNDMDAVTIDQGPAIDLTVAKRFCQQATSQE
jgi:Leucine-rich repeat (LRR) protein